MLGHSPPSRHVVLKYSSTQTSAAASLDTGALSSTDRTMGDHSEQAKKRSRKKRASMESQVMEDQGVLINGNEKRTSTLRRSNRHNIIKEAADEDDDDENENENDMDENEYENDMDDEDERPHANPQQSQQQSVEPIEEQTNASTALPERIAPPITSPAPTPKPVGRPKGRPARGRKPANPQPTTGARRGRRAAAPKDTASTPTGHAADDQDHELLEHQAELADQKPPTHNSLAFEAVNRLYTIELNAEDDWRDTADDVADCLYTLREQWQILEAKRRKIIRDARTLNLQTNVHGMSPAAIAASNAAESSLREKSSRRERYHRHDSSNFQSSDSSQVNLRWCPKAGHQIK